MNTDREKRCFVPDTSKFGFVLSFLPRALHLWRLCPLGDGREGNREREGPGRPPQAGASQSPSQPPVFFQRGTLRGFLKALGSLGDTLVSLDGPGSGGWR